MVSMSRQPVSNVLNVADLEWTFGDKLRKIRRAARASQGDFADQIGQTSETLSAWEAGRNQPRNIVSIAKRIELAYGVAAGWVLGIQESPYPSGPWPDDDGAPRTGLEPVTLCTAVRDNIVRVDFTRAAA